VIRIGVFARISQAPVSLLRYYDEIGLFKAAHTDSVTGYRYYALDQLPLLWRIMALKDLGLSLDEIRRLLDEELSADELRGMLRLKLAELRRRMQEEAERLARLENWIAQFDQEEAMPDYEVVSKKVDPTLVLSIRDEIPDYPAQGALWDELDAYVCQRQISVRSPGITLYYQEEPTIVVEVGLPPNDPGAAGQPAEGRVRLQELPAIEMAASTLHSGPLNAIGNAYQALMGWIESQGLKICGPVREVYLRGPDSHSQTDPGVVVEIQAPVARA
jgi:DNA-binding transcriptional MerR regulator